MKKIIPISILIFILLVGLACSLPFSSDKNENETEARATVSEPLSGSAITPQAQQITVSPQTYESDPIKIVELTQLPDVGIDGEDSGSICFVSNGNGMVCYRSTGWDYYDVQSGKLDSNYINRVKQCLNGDLIFGQSGQIYVLSVEGKKTTIKFPDGFYASVEDLTCTSADDFWMTHLDGITHVKNQTWETFAIADLIPTGLEYGLVEKIIMDQNGSLWITLPNFILRYDQQAWVVYGEENGFNQQYFIEDILEAADGSIYAAASLALLHNQGNYWEPIEYPESRSVSGLTADPQGNLWIYGDGFLWRYETKEKSWDTFDFSTETFANISHRINKVVIDLSGKFWFSSDWGVGVWDGASWETILMENSPIVDNEIKDLLLLGDSAPKPDISAEPPGKLSGSIFDENENALQGIKVQICVLFLSDYTLTNLDPGETPCESQPYFQQITTDVNGSFIFNQVPEGFYYLTAEIEPEMWALLTGDFGFGEQIPIISEENLEIGELYVTTDE